jgi:drug/metabolite transporter (DMT)-like permease
MARWVFWMLLTLLSWGIWAVLSRLIGGDISPAQSQAMSTLGLAPIIVALWAIKEPPASANRPRGAILAFGSGLISCLGNVAYYSALGDAKAATVVPLTALYPAVTILLAVPLLKERISPIQIVGMALSLIAIALFNAPGEQRGASVWMLAALCAVVLWGVASLMQKASTFYLSGARSAFWFLAAFVPIAACIFALSPLPSDVTSETWGLAAALGFTLGFGNLTLLLAYAAGGKAAVIAPLSGLYPIVSIPIAILAFDEHIGMRESLGIALALASVVMLTYAPEPEGALAANIEGKQT